MQEVEAVLLEFHSNLTQQALKLQQRHLEETASVENGLQSVAVNPVLWNFSAYQKANVTEEQYHKMYRDITRYLNKN